MTSRAEDHALDPTARRGEQAAESRSRVTQLRALLVEDSVHDAELVAHELAQNGYEVELARVDSAESLGAALGGHAWDVILCDYNLPSFGAIQALEIVHERGIDTPFIVLSGNIGEEAAVEALQAGALDCVLKSNLPRLIPVIHREIGRAHV